MLKSSAYYSQAIETVTSDSEWEVESTNHQKVR